MGESKDVSSLTIKTQSTTAGGGGGTTPISAKELAPERNHILAQLPNLSTETLLLIIKRLESWKSLISFLMSQAEVLKSSEKHCVSVITKSAKASKEESRVVVSAFPESSKLATLATTVIGNIDRSVSQLEIYIASIKTQILPNLKTMRNEITDRISQITTMSKESTKDFQKEIKRATELMERLDAIVALTAHDQHDSTKDPWFVSLTLSKSFRRALDQYNIALDKVNATKTSLMVWEEDISNRIESNISLLLSGANGNTDKSKEEIASFIKIDPREEWKLFEDMCQSRCTVLENPDEIFTVPRHELNTPLMEGPMRYLSSVLKKWKECYIVLTPVGWLHQFNEKPDISNGDLEHPKRSVWLKSCTLAPLHIPGQHHDELAVTRCEKPGLGTTKSSTARYTSVNHADLRPWWNAVSTLTRVNLRAEENSAQPFNSEIFGSSPATNPASQSNFLQPLNRRDSAKSSDHSDKNNNADKSHDRLANSQNGKHKSMQSSGSGDLAADASKTARSSHCNILNIDTSGFNFRSKKGSEDNQKITKRLSAKLSSHASPAASSAKTP